jgi:hypothetical protein
MARVVNHANVQQTVAVMMVRIICFVIFMCPHRLCFIGKQVWKEVEVVLATMVGLVNIGVLIDSSYVCFLFLTFLLFSFFFIHQ